MEGSPLAASAAPSAEEGSPRTTYVVSNIPAGELPQSHSNGNRTRETHEAFYADPAVNEPLVNAGAASSASGPSTALPEVALRGPGRAAVGTRPRANTAGESAASLATAVSPSSTSSAVGVAQSPAGSTVDATTAGGLHSDGGNWTRSPVPPPLVVGGPGGPQLPQQTPATTTPAAAGNGFSVAASATRSNVHTTAALDASEHFHSDPSASPGLRDSHRPAAAPPTGEPPTTSYTVCPGSGVPLRQPLSPHRSPPKGGKPATTVVAAATTPPRHPRPPPTGTDVHNSNAAAPSVPPAMTAPATQSVKGPHSISASAAAVASSDTDAEAHHSYRRPCYSLSVHLVSLYKRINARYCLQRRLDTPGLKYNNGYDDKHGHYIVLPGEEILSRYTVQEVLGKGSFGTVLRCYDEKHRMPVALKITRNGANFRSQAKLELDILIQLNSKPAMNDLVVKLLKVFDWKNHLVLVFELLSFNLYQLIKCTRYNGVSLELVRKFAYQLVDALDLLERHSPPIIHSDLKPENILLRNKQRSGIRLIDFGSACYANRRMHRYIQSRYYRSPEVILYLEYTTAIDRWSLACVLVELHTGVPLFDGHTEEQQLLNFEAMLGPMPADMIVRSSKATNFYCTTREGRSRLISLMKPPYHGSPEPRTLESVLGVTTGGPRGNRWGTPGHDEASYREFHSFISQLLRYRPEERMSCRSALQHPFLNPLFKLDVNHRYAKQTAPTMAEGTETFSDSQLGSAP